jgi:Uncharacterized ACR, COG1993
MLSADGSLLRIFVGESDRYEQQPLYEWIVIQARAQGLAGAQSFEVLWDSALIPGSFTPSRLSGYRKISP